jgi:ATP-dependent DNA helicase RecG
MLTAEELAVLLTDLESDRIERTISTTNTDKFAEAICAFANDYPNHRQPGYLLIGLHDDGAPSGLVVTDLLLRNLAGIRSDGNVLPAPAMSVSKLSLPGGEVAVVEVAPSSVPPVRYKGKVYIRVGPRKAVANEQEERVLSERRSSLISTFDLHPVREAGLSDLSQRLFDEYRAVAVNPDVVAANHRSTEEKYASLRCFDLIAGCPTVASILLFGKNPRYFLPGAYVQFVRFPGATMTDLPIDQKEISGDLRTVVEGIRSKIDAYNAVSLGTGEGFRDRPRPLYPEWALRELLLNAVMHRDYASTSPIRFYWFSDRIEVQSPGGLYGTVTRETLTRRNAYRNPVLAEALKAMDYVNKFGYGLQRAEQLMRDGGHPPLEFEIDDRVFAVTVRVVQP